MNTGLGVEEKQRKGSFQNSVSIAQARFRERKIYRYIYRKQTSIFFPSSQKKINFTLFFFNLLLYYSVSEPRTDIYILLLCYIKSFFSLFSY